MSNENYNQSALFERAPEASRSRFNPDMLSMARKASSLSQSELALRMEVSQPLIGKWEASLSMPDPSQVEALSQALDVTPSFFFVDRTGRLASMSDFYHRALSTAKRGDVKAIHAKCSMIDVQVDRLLELIEDDTNDTIPHIESNSDKFKASEVERIAVQAREMMGCQSGPILNLTSVIESCGGIIIDRDFEVREVMALCRWVPGLPKMFFVNGSMPADRLRMSLAHELGHTVMHFGGKYDYNVAEEQARRFAAAFLMPESDIKKDFKRSVSLAELAAMKRKWRVSMQGIAYRLHALGLIDSRRYKSICVQISRKGWKKSEPVSIAGETPKRFRSLLQAHLDRGYTHEELASLLFMRSDNVLRNLLADYTESPGWEDQGVRLRLVRD